MFLASVIFLIFSVVVDFISLQIMASNSELQQEEIIPYLLNTLNFPGLKGLFCIAVLSLAVSTADSELNASSVILANDVLVPLFNLKISADLIRRVIFITGFVAIVISLFASSILDIFMTIGDWIFPLDEFSFLAIMLGIRTSKYVIYFAMGSGFFPVLIYHLLGYEGYACFLGMLGNFFGFIIAHLVWKYFFKSDDPNIYYNQKDNFKRLKDFEYDDEIEREKQRLEEIERQKNLELRNEFKRTLNIKMKEIVEKYKNDENNNRKEIEKIREHVMKDKEKNNKKS
jgi:Na+/proline symporter